jgi:glycerol kinase
MRAGTILAIDQGTTNTKALLFDPTGCIIAQGASSAAMEHPQPGWAQQDGLVIWDSVVDAIAQVRAAAPEVDVAAIGISNQRESALLWDRVTGQPLGPCISWQCRRSSDMCRRLAADGCEAAVLSATGLKLDPMFSAGKIAWLLDNVPEARARAEAGEICAGTVDSWLLFKLTGVHATDHSNAARTQLMHLASGQWDPAMLDLFGIPAVAMPQIYTSAASFGETLPDRTAIGAGVPVLAMMGDSHAALFCLDDAASGRVKVTIGTGSSLMATTGGKVPHSGRLSNTVAWSDKQGCRFALEGNITISGRAAAFATTLLGLADEAQLTELARSVPDSGGVVFVPALAGLGAPHWQPDARGQLTGMTLVTGPAHVARAALEAIALQINDVFSQMERDLGGRLPGIAVDGGAARNDFLLQLLADVLDRDVERSGCTEASAFGVARLAARGLGNEIPAAPPAAHFTPQAKSGERQRLLADWRRAVGQASVGAQDDRGKLHD